MSGTIWREITWSIGVGWVALQRQLENYESGLNIRQVFTLLALDFPLLCRHFLSFWYWFSPKRSSNKTHVLIWFCQIHNATLKEHDMQMCSAVFYCEIIFVGNEKLLMEWKCRKIKGGETGVLPYLVGPNYSSAFVSVSTLFSTIRIAHRHSFCHTYWTSFLVIISTLNVFVTKAIYIILEMIILLRSWSQSRSVCFCLEKLQKCWIRRK